MEWGRKLSFALSDKGRACSFSRVASATEYLPSRWPAVSGDTDGPSFSRHFAETGTRFLKERKKKYTADSEKLQESVKGRCDYRSEIMVSRDWIFYFCYQCPLCNGLISLMIEEVTWSPLADHCDKLCDDMSIECLIYTKVELSNRWALHDGNNIVLYPGTLPTGKIQNRDTVVRHKYRMRIDIPEQSSRSSRKDRRTRVTTYKCIMRSKNPVSITTNSELILRKTTWDR